MENHILLHLRKATNLPHLLQLHSLITKSGHLTTPLILTKLLICSVLPSWGSLHHANSIFLSLPPRLRRDRIVLNTVIRAFSSSLFPSHALHLYNSMCGDGVTPDHLTYPFVLRACGRVGERVWRKGAETHCRVLRFGFGGDVFVGNSLVYMYGKCGRVRDAREVFDGMVDRSVVSWNAMIAVYSGKNQIEAAEEFLGAMPEWNVVSWNTVIAGFVRVNDVAGARRVFDGMTERDVVSWNSLIAGYVGVRDYESVFEVFDLMQVNLVRPTKVTLVSVLGACAETGALEMGRRIHRYMKQSGLRIEGYVGNALLDMYAKCGNLKLAREVFDEMGMKHVTCWNTMIVGLAVHGFCNEALDLFSKMEKDSGAEANPNRVTFLGVLLACSHKGLAKEGQRLFSRMMEVYKIEPDVKHYGCMVDMLSRGGLLDEAHQMIKTMPFKANSVLWRTILGASRVYGDVNMAEEAYKEICKFEVPNYGDCVTLSNSYADAGRWTDLEILRVRMNDQCVPRQSGYSQVEAK